MKRKVYRRTHSRIAKMVSSCKVVVLVLKAVVLITCSAFFGKSALEAVKTYNSGLKSMTTSATLANPDGIQLPTLVFCNQSGFKNVEINTRLNDYKANTMTLKDFYISVERNDVIGKQNKINFTIDPVYSAFKGICYALSIKEKAKPFQTYVISLTSKHNLNLYTMEPGSEMFIVLDVWPEKPTKLAISAETAMSDIYVEKQILEKTEDCIEDKTYNFYSNLLCPAICCELSNMRCM
jgi:hypothetical protein